MELLELLVLPVQGGDDHREGSDDVRDEESAGDAEDARQDELPIALRVNFVPNEDLYRSVEGDQVLRQDVFFVECHVVFLVLMLGRVPLVVRVDNVEEGARCQVDVDQDHEQETDHLDRQLCGF